MLAIAWPIAPGALPASRAYAGGRPDGAGAGASVGFVAGAGSCGKTLVPQPANAITRTTILIGQSRPQDLDDRRVTAPVRRTQSAVHSLRETESACHRTRRRMQKV